MGNVYGTTQPPPSKLLTDTPWRTSPERWDQAAQDEIIRNINSQKTTVHPNILAVGPIGAGKSSFITAILSIGRDIRYGAAVTGKNPTSCTLKFQRYTKHTLLEDVNLFDCMGIEANQGLGVHLKDIELLLKGHIKNQYEFNPKSPIDPEHKDYRENPTATDRINCVVFVLSACTLNTVAQPIIDKIKQLQDLIQREGIPRVIVLTQCDLLCKEVHENPANMFLSAQVEKAVKLASELFYIERASIHPVVNYEDIPKIQPEINIPLLLAVQQMRQYAIDQRDLIGDQK